MHPYGNGGEWHLDNEHPNSITFLYYPHLEWEVTGGGALFFIEDDEIIKTVTYKPNRGIIFPANIQVVIAKKVKRPITIVIIKDSKIKLYL